MMRFAVLLLVVGCVGEVSSPGPLPIEGQASLSAPEGAALEEGEATSPTDVVGPEVSPAAEQSEQEPQQAEISAPDEELEPGLGEIEPVGEPIAQPVNEPAEGELEVSEPESAEEVPPTQATPEVCRAEYYDPVVLEQCGPTKPVAMLDCLRTPENNAAFLASKCETRRLLDSAGVVQQGHCCSVAVDL